MKVLENKGNLLQNVLCKLLQKYILKEVFDMTNEQLIKK